MTDEVQFIVSHLNKGPFDMRNIRLVDFDEKSNLELLQILNDVFTSIDKKMEANVGNEEENTSKKRFISFLSLIRYKDIPSEEKDYHSWIQKLCSGDKTVIYPILYFCFNNYDKLQNRAYLAPFLMPIELPPSILMQENDVLAELANQYKSLQATFKNTHKDYKFSKKICSSQGGIILKNEVVELCSERKQLLKKIAEVEEKMNGTNAFMKMLEATKLLRKEQDQEIRLMDQAVEQERKKVSEETKLQTLQHRFDKVHSISNDGDFIPSLFDDIQKEIVETTDIVQINLVTENNKLLMELEQLEQERHEPTRSEEELKIILVNLKETEDEFSLKEKKLDDENSKRSCTKVSLYKQHAVTAVTKLERKGIDLENKNKEVIFLKDIVKELKKTLERFSSKEGKTMLTDESLIENNDINFLATRYKTNVQEYETIGKRIILIKLENEILKRTEETLKNKFIKVEDFINNEEKKAGVGGYRDTKTQLVNTSCKTVEIDRVKGQTLEEISEMVKTIANTLGKKKGLLQPMMKGLKSIRLKYQDLEEQYKDKQKRYEKVADKLFSEREPIEKECDKLQKEWLDEERNYHYITNLNNISRLNLEKVSMESSWRKGTERFHHNFKSLKELYEDKLLEQVNITKEFRKEQRILKENEDDHKTQKSFFLELHLLLEQKMKDSSTDDNTSLQSGLEGSLLTDSFDTLILK